MFGESSAIYPHAVIHLLVPTMLRWNIVFDETFWIRTGPGKKSQFLPAPRNMNIWKVFAPRHLWIFSDEGEKKKRERTLHIRLFAGSILPSCNIVAMRLVHAVWIAMNDRFGEGKWPVMASYDNIYTRRVIEPALSSSVRFRKNAAETSRFSPFLLISK